jgi:hypothetical protein
MTKKLEKRLKIGGGRRRRFAEELAAQKEKGWTRKRFGKNVSYHIFCAAVVQSHHSCHDVV